MKLTKFTHSCVRLESAGGALVIDPGTFSGADELEAALAGVEAVLVTHEHPDHLDVEVMARMLRERPDLRVFGPQSIAALLGQSPGADRVQVVGAGDSFEAGGLPLTTHGGQHALIHASVPVVANLAFVVAGSVLHPGDSFFAPPEPVDTLLLPLHAPWSKVGEVLDHVAAVRAVRVHPVHDGLLNERGLGVVEQHARRVTGEYGNAYSRLAVGEEAQG